MYSSYDNTLSVCSTKHNNIIMQVYFVLRKELLQAGILELDTLFSLLSTLDVVYNAFIDVARSLSLPFFLRRIGTYKTPPISSKAPPSASTSQPVMLLTLFVKTFLSLFPHPLLPPNRPLVHIYIYLFRKSAGAHGYYTIPKIKTEPSLGYS